MDLETPTLIHMALETPRSPQAMVETPTPLIPMDLETPTPIHIAPTPRNPRVMVETRTLQTPTDLATKPDLTTTAAQTTTPPIHKVKATTMAATALPARSWTRLAASSRAIPSSRRAKLREPKLEITITQTLAPVTTMVVQGVITMAVQVVTTTMITITTRSSSEIRSLMRG
jgi:hypothetical protein